MLIDKEIQKYIFFQIFERFWKAVEKCWKFVVLWANNSGKVKSSDKDQRPRRQQQQVCSGSGPPRYVNKWPRVARIARPGLLSRQLRASVFRNIDWGPTVLPALRLVSAATQMKVSLRWKVRKFCCSQSQSPGGAGPGVVQSLKPTQPQTQPPHHLIAINKGQLHCTLKNQLQ